MTRAARALGLAALVALPASAVAQPAEAAPAPPPASPVAPAPAAAPCVPAGQPVGPGQVPCVPVASAPPAPPTSTPAAPAPSAATPGPAAPAAVASATPSSPAAAAGSSSATFAPPAPATPGAPSTPGQTQREREEADQQAALRALERTLVQKGGLLVPRWGIELVPAFSFAYSDGPAIAAATAGGALLGAQSETMTGALTLRIGLPLSTQVEATAPYVFSRLTPGGNDPSPPAEATGLGDVRVGLTWHAIGARGSIPDVLVGGYWKSRSGRTAFDEPGLRVALGSGVEQFGGTLAIVKAVDPVVLLATANYAVAAPRWIPQGWLQAGDEFGGSAGVLLAVSPETSLSFGLEATFARPLALDGTEIYKSDRTEAVFRLGVSTLASAHGFFQVSLGMGLTSEVPRFEVQLATPIRF